MPGKPLVDRPMLCLILGLTAAARLPVDDVLDRQPGYSGRRQTRGAAEADVGLWPGCAVPFVVAEAGSCPFSQSICNMAADAPTAVIIRRSIAVSSAELQRLTSCRFYEVAADNADAVVVTAKEDKCYVNHIGKLPSGRNIMNLGKGWCSTDEGSVKHELLHVLGVEHEHQSPRSDPMLTRCAVNQCDPNNANCRIDETVTEWKTTSYDPRSIMHYPLDSACDLALTPEGNTIRARSGITADHIGRVDNISSADAAFVRTLYGLGPVTSPSGPTSGSSSGLSDGLLVGIALGAVALIGIGVIFAASCGGASKPAYKPVPKAQF